MKLDRRFLCIVILVVFVKAALAAVTPLSTDFRNIAYGALWVSQGLRFQGPYTFSVNLMNQMYNLWMMMPFDHQWIYSGYDFVPSFSAFALVFMFKLPIIVCDMLATYVIYSLVLYTEQSHRLAKFSALVWLLNPYVTLVVEMDGTMDIMSTFLVVLSCYLFIRRKHGLSGICLALATVARFYPIVLLPFFIIVLAREGKTRSLIATLGSYILPLLVVLCSLVAVYGASILSTIYSIPVGGNNEFIWFFGFMPSSASTSEMVLSSVVTILIVMGFLMFRVWRMDRVLILDMVLIALLTFVGLSHFNRYYTIWLLPFLTMDLARNWVGTYRRVYAILFTLFFLFAFMYNFAYWWSTSFFFIYEFTPEISWIAEIVRTVGLSLRLGDVGTTFTQSILSGACIIYAILVAARHTLRMRSRSPSEVLDYSSSLRECGLS